MKFSGFAQRCKFPTWPSAEPRAQERTQISTFDSSRVMHFANNLECPTQKPHGPMSAQIHCGLEAIESQLDPHAVQVNLISLLHTCATGITQETSRFHLTSHTCASRIQTHQPLSFWADTTWCIVSIDTSWTLDGRTKIHCTVAHMGITPQRHMV